MEQEVEYLGHIRTTEWTKENNIKIDAKTKRPILEPVTDVQRILDFCIYYRKVVKDFSIINHPWTDLTKQKNDYLGKNDQQNAFDIPKIELVHASLLKLADHTFLYEVTRDASSTGFGAVWTQAEKKRKRPIE